MIVVPDKGEEADAMDLISKLDWRGQACLLDYGDDFKDPNDFLVAGKRRELEVQLARYA